MILLVRHGQTEFNIQGRLQGTLDSPLSDEGIRHARTNGTLIRALLGEEIDRYSVVSSPLGRAKATAEIICGELGLRDIVVDDRLAEVSFGDWEGLTKEQVEARWPGKWQSSVRCSWAAGCPGGESYTQAIERAADWLNSHRTRHVIAVSHGAMGSLIRGVYANLAKDRLLRLPVPHDTVFAMTNGRVDPISSP